MRRIERRVESDDEVRSIRPAGARGPVRAGHALDQGGPRETRTETFLRYAEEHPRAYLDAIEDKTEALIRDSSDSRRKPHYERATRATNAAALKHYGRDHWGQKGKQETKRLSLPRSHAGGDKGTRRARRPAAVLSRRGHRGQIG
jgi:hypothetical protein